MKQKIRFGLFGCNMYRTRDLLAGAVAAAGDSIEIVACFDIDAEKAEVASQKYGGKSFTREEEFLAHPDIDVVLISLPAYLHAQAFIHTAKAGKDIYLEKPICVNDTDRDAILEAAAQYPVRCYVGMSYRYIAPFRKVAEILRRTEAGAILGVHHHWYSSDVSEPEMPGWRHRLDQSGGQLIHHCCHVLDWFEWIGGKTKSVTANAFNVTAGPMPHEEREITACFEYANSGMAVFNLSQHSHMYVQCGTVHTENLGIEYRWGDRTYVRVYQTRSRAADEVYEWSLTSQPGDGGETDRNRLQMAEFIEAYRSGGPMPISIPEGIRTYDLASAIRHSHRSGQRVDVSRSH